MNTDSATMDDLVDAEADALIAECVAGSPPRSFFLFAGAGSGKTGSLVKALKVIRKRWNADFHIRGHRVGVITFTNKACDEIKHRLEYDELFAVSTIHSFAWSLINGLNHDIRELLRHDLQVRIQELEEAQNKGRRNSQAWADRAASIRSHFERLERLDHIRRFIYNPDGDNLERDALNHSEVIHLTAHFLRSRPMMQSLLVNRFPILLIDESQDTDQELVEALCAVQAVHKDRFALGIIGDMMQRIYLAGKPDLGTDLPRDWAKPVKKMNHRSCHRVVRLINRIREPIDRQIQQARTDRGQGFVRLFIAPSIVSDKPQYEADVCTRMAEITGDRGWLSPRLEVKTLILEHHMAAARLGFLELWEALNGVSRLQAGLRDGSLSELRFFSEIVMPVIVGRQSGDLFAVASVVRKYSPLMDQAALETSLCDQMNQIAIARQAAEKLGSLRCGSHTQPSFGGVLQCVFDTGLFRIPDTLRAFVEKHQQIHAGENEAGHDRSDEITAWRRLLDSPIEQVVRYREYIQGLTQYDTHQGIKGLEYPRVCVIMDDSAARGFTFSYEHLFGVKAPKRPEPGRETAADRTRRLFYVTCSRAMDSLALVAYTSDPGRLRSYAIVEGWFDSGEVETILQIGR